MFIFVLEVHGLRSAGPANWSERDRICAEGGFHGDKGAERERVAKLNLIHPLAASRPPIRLTS